MARTFIRSTKLAKLAMVYINVSAMALKAWRINMKRLFDLALACLVLPFLILPMLYLAFQVRRSSSGPALYWSARIGQHNQLFMMPKYRSMFVETPEVATHLLKDSTNHITPLGTWLRRTSLDELPQLYSIIVGHMSFVGPRPALFNQDDLKQMRTEKGIHTLKPYMTGLAQIMAEMKSVWMKRWNWMLTILKGTIYCLIFKFCGKLSLKWLNVTILH